MASSTFSEYKVPELQDFLKVKGISVSSLKKQHLIKLCEAVKLLDLPDDPDMCRGKLETVEAMLQKYGINDPFNIQGLSNNLSELPTFSLYDVCNYSLYKTSNYDQRKLKAYKSCEDYRLFYDGYVEHLEMKVHGEICVVKSCVKPTQKDKTYLNKTVYDVWVIMGKLNGDVKTAYCTCIGGADGGCRHIGATLYEIEAFEVKSVTDGDNLWLKRPRHHDCPVPIKQLKIMKARYSSVSHQDQPHHVQDFDPRTTDQRNSYSEAKLLDIATELRKISPHIQALDLLEDPSLSVEDSASETDCDICNRHSVLLAVQESQESFVSNEFLNSISMTTEDILHIEECTIGQSDDKKWLELRKGRLTASNFSKVCNAIDNSRCPPSLLKTILGEYDLSNCEVPSLEWGRKKEKTAISLYMRVNRNAHKCAKMTHRGLHISDTMPYIGCSVDGIFECQCHGKKIVEVKCPYNMRESLPREVALQNGCVIDRTGKLFVTKTCPYYRYHQIQGQMGIYGIPEADLIIYTKKGISVAGAKIDDVFFLEMCRKFDLFFHSYLGQALFNLKNEK